MRPVDLLDTTLSPKDHYGAPARTPIVDRKAEAEAGGKLLDLVRDEDELLASRPEFLLGWWLEDPKRWGSNDAERRLCEMNARTIITLWGPRDSILHEYAQREWAGLLRGFYLPSWGLFVRRIDETLAAGKPLDAAKLEGDLRDLELAWTRGTEPYAAAPRGDAVDISRRLRAKNGRWFSAEPDAPSMTTGKPATCSSFLPPHEPGRADDRRTLSTDRYWATDVSRDPAAWWQVDLGPEKSRSSPTSGTSAWRPWV
jgi:hypothetical protein